MGVKKSNWQKINEQKPSETVKHRDVYDDQQLDRGRIQNKQSPLSRILFVAFTTLFVMAVLWFFIALVQFGVGAIGSMSGDISAGGSSKGVGSGNSAYPYVVSDTVYPKDENGIIEKPVTMYYACDENGNIISEGYESYEEVPIPQWYYDYAAENDIDVNAQGQSSGQVQSYLYYLRPDFWKIFICLLVGAILFSILYQVMMRNLDAQNMMNTTEDINQYTNDQHIQLPEEVQRNYDWFPDVGAHSSVQASALISHMALSNKGVNHIRVARRADKDIKDEDGETAYYKGEVICDEDGNPVYDTKPVFDEKFMEALFDASGALKDKKVRKYYDTSKIPYNPGNEDRDKLSGYDTVADLINGDWELPDYEPQRPGGAYIVDTQPVNTMV